MWDKNETLANSSALEKAAPQKHSTIDDAGV